MAKSRMDKMKIWKRFNYILSFIAFFATVVFVGHTLWSTFWLCAAMVAQVLMEHVQGIALRGYITNTLDRLRRRDQNLIIHYSTSSGYGSMSANID